MQKRFITPEDKFQYFFGYYDLQPYDETNEKHLVHRVKLLASYSVMKKAFEEKPFTDKKTRSQSYNV